MNSMPGSPHSWQSYRVVMISPRRSIICCGVGNAFTRFLGDGRVCLTTAVPEPSAAKPGCSGAPIAAANASWFFTPLIQTCRLNDVDPQAWLAEILARIANRPASRFDELLPWHWAARQKPPKLVG